MTVDDQAARLVISAQADLESAHRVDQYRSEDDPAAVVQCQGCGAVRDGSFLGKGHACWRNEDGTYEEGGSFQ